MKLEGRRFGRLIVVSEAPYQRGKGTYWNCVCDCGGEKVARGVQLTRRNTTSCGCRLTDGSVRRIHGLSKTRIYDLWTQMIMRCENPNNKAYDRYGGRGIRVCKRWAEGDASKTGFEYFLEDMGPKPRGLSLDRINVDGHYEPSNCRWATGTEQCRNKTNNARVEYEGGVYTWSELAEKGVVSPQLLRSRVVQWGWDLKEAMFTPAKKIAPAGARAGHSQETQTLS